MMCGAALGPAHGLAAGSAMPVQALVAPSWKPRWWPAAVQAVGSLLGCASAQPWWGQVAAKPLSWAPGRAWAQLCRWLAAAQPVFRVPGSASAPPCRRKAWLPACWRRGVASVRPWCATAWAVPSSKRSSARRPHRPVAGFSGPATCCNGRRRRLHSAWWPKLPAAPLPAPQAALMSPQPSAAQALPLPAGQLPAAPAAPAAARPRGTESW
jgi:hypothetical protein